MRLRAVGIVLAGLASVSPAGGQHAGEPDEPRRVRLVVNADTPKDGTTPDLKWIVEAEPAVLDTGTGELYLRFDLARSDELSWEPDSDIVVSVETRDGVRRSAFVRDTAERATDPGEHVVEVAGWSDEPLHLTARYRLCEVGGPCGPRTARFTVRRYRATGAVSDLDRRRVELLRREGRNGPTGLMRSLMELDADGNGKLERSEVPESMTTLSSEFDTLDRNGDGAVDAREIEEMTRVPWWRRRR